MAVPKSPVKLERQKAFECLYLSLLKWLWILAATIVFAFPAAVIIRAGLSGEGLSQSLFEAQVAYFITVLRLDRTAAPISYVAIAILFATFYLVLKAKHPERLALDFSRIERIHLYVAIPIAFAGAASASYLLGNPYFLLEAYLSWIKSVRPYSIFGLASLIEFTLIFGIPLTGWFIEGRLLNPHDFTPYLPEATSRFATLRETRRWGIHRTGKSGQSQGYIGVLGQCPITRQFYMMPETLMALCMAPPGTGKTTGLVVPTLLLNIQNPKDGVPISFVVHDPKVEDRQTRAGRMGEVALLTSGYRSEQGSDCYNLNFSALDDPENGIFYPSWNYMSPQVVPPAGGKRDNYIERMVSIIYPDTGGNADPFWTRAARSAEVGFHHFIIAKVERAKLQGKINDIVAAPEYGEDPEAITPLAEQVREALLSEMDYCGYHGPLRDRLLKDKGISAVDAHTHRVGTWEGMPQKWTPAGRIGDIEPSMAMLIDYLSDAIAQHANPGRSNPKPSLIPAAEKPADGEAEAYWRMVDECVAFNYPGRAKNELISLANLAPQTRTSITKQRDTHISVFQNTAVVQRTSSTDIVMSHLRGRWDRTMNGGKGGFRSSTIYISVPTEDAERLGPLTALLVEAMISTTSSTSPNNVKLVTRYHRINDKIADLVATGGNSNELSSLRKQLARLKRILTLDELGNPVGPCHICFLIDEFPILPRISGLMIGPEAARGRKVAFYLIGQTLPQIAAKYGEPAVTRFLGNAWAVVVLPVGDDQTADRLAKLAGHTTVLKESISMSSKEFFSSNKSIHLASISLIEPTHLRAMGRSFGEGRHILYTRDKHSNPVIAITPKYFADPILKTLVHPSVLPHNHAKPPEEWVGGKLEAPAMPAHAMAMHKIKAGHYDRANYSKEELALLSTEALDLIAGREAFNAALNNAA